MVIRWAWIDRRRNTNKLNSFSPSVFAPAWPRYRVLRVQELGQYNLEILSADLSDDSLYECQAPDAALRSRRAKLTVLSAFVCQSYKTGRSCSPMPRGANPLLLPLQFPRTTP